MDSDSEAHLTQVNITLIELEYYFQKIDSTKLSMFYVNWTILQSIKVIFVVYLLN